MSGMAVGGESDWNLGGICGGKVSDVVCCVVVVSQHKTVVNVSKENKQASSVVVRKKCQFPEQQNQVSNLPTMVAVHCYPFRLLVSVLSRKEKVAVVNKIV